MYLVDLNVLLHAAVGTASRHELALRWLDERLDGRVATVGLPWPSLLGFVRAVTGPGLLDPPVDLVTAWQQVERWLDAPAAWIPPPGPRHAQLITEMLHGPTIVPAPRPVSILHLAALAIENGLTVATTDPAFERIPHVRWYNPIGPLQG